MMDLTMKTGSSSSSSSTSHHHHHPKNEVKVSPFSAEALLSKSSSSTSSTPVTTYAGLHRGSNVHSSAVTSTPPSKVATPPRASPSTYAPPRASPLFSPSTSQTSSEKSRSSPWHTPVSLSSSSGRPPTSTAKPAIPVSPVVREDKNKDLSFQAALLGLGAAAAGTNASTAMPPVSLPLPPTTYGNSLSAAQQSMASMAMAGANPYLALAAAGMPKSTGSSAGTPSFPSHLMDPTSAYYAALYSQSLYGLGSPYAAAAGMRLPGMSHSAAAAAAAAAAAPPNPGSAAANSMDLMALHAMMTRGQTAGAGPSSNPYAGYPASALSGLLGYPGFPPAPPHSGRKDP